METTFNGLGMSIGNLSRLSKAQTRSISAENFQGEKGKAGMATEGTGAGHYVGTYLAWGVNQTDFTKASNVLGCTGGTLWIRSASTMISE